MGVGVRMQRTPAVFEERRRWRPEFKEGEICETWAQNYPSAAGKPEILAAKLREAKEAGRLVPFTYRQAREE